VERFTPTPWSIERIALAVAALVWCAALGVLAAKILTSQDAEARGPTVLRTHNGATETGVVETVTIDGAVRRVIQWRTREGTVTQTVEGPMHLRTVQGSPVRVPGPTATMVHTVTTRGLTVTLPGETVTETAQSTVTEMNTVTETVTESVTVTAPAP
jgi:hypothetical protein